jgi:hypothetical protein
MSATLFTDMATAIASAVHAAGIAYDGNPLKVYDYEPKDLDTLPAVTVGGPTAMSRPEPEARQSQLGSDDWHITYTLRIFTKLDDPEDFARESRAILGQVIAAIDADETLGGTADLGAAIANGFREFHTDDKGRKMGVYVCDLRAWALIP